MTLAACPGFGPGAMVMTTQGEMPVEWLESGDRVITRDHGAQPILWIERWRWTGPEGGRLAAPLRLVPASGNRRGGLIEPLRLGPGHRVLASGAAVELHFGAEAALAGIADLAGTEAREDLDSARTYHHLVLARHEVIWTCGIWAESAGPELAARLRPPPSVRAASAIFREGAQTTAPCLDPVEAALLRRLTDPAGTVLALLAA